MQIWRLRSAVVGMATLLLAATQLQAQTPEAVVQIDMPAQSLADALRAVARQTNTNILVDPKLIEGRRVPAVNERLSLKQALQKLLKGTGLRPKYVDDGTITLLAAGAETAKTSLATNGRRYAAPYLSRSDGSPEDRARSDYIRLAENDVAEDVVEGDSQQKMESVVVTAQKREERLVDVPASVAAVTAAEIQERNYVGASDYLRGMPGVNQTENNAGQSIVIHGIASAYTTGQTAATFFGESSLTGTTGLNGTNNDIKLVDIERIEVLRSPQGTAFGAAGIGGAVRIIPKEPDLDKYELKLSSEYSSTAKYGGDNYNFEAIGNAPLIDGKLSLRAVAYKFDDSGYYRNVAATDPAFQALLVIPYGAQAYAHDERNVGHTVNTGARASLLFRPDSDFSLEFNYLTQTQNMDGDPYSNVRSYESRSLDIAPVHGDGMPETGYASFKTDVANVTAKQSLGPIQLFGSYSYIRGEGVFSGSIGENVGEAAWDYWGDSINYQHQVELRMTSKFDGPLNFLAGLYYEHFRDNYLESYIWTGDPAKDTFQTGVVNLGADHENRLTVQRAAFGEIYWTVLPDLTLTGGGRYYNYERSYTDFGGGPLYAGGILALNPPKISPSGQTYKAELSYKPGKDLNFYVNFSQGFRLGQPSPPLPASECDENNTGFVDGTHIPIAATGQLSSDTTNSYELGFKGARLGGRASLDVDIFRVDWNNIPIDLAFPGCKSKAAQAVLNAGNARSQGVEFESQIELTASASAYVGASYDDARLTSVDPNSGFRAGERLPYVPNWNANWGLEYSLPVLGHAAALRADLIYVGSLYGQEPPTSATKAGDYLKADLSARVELGNATLSLFVKNALDSSKSLSVSFSREYNQLQPRTIGANFGYAF